MAQWYKSEDPSTHKHARWEWQPPCNPNMWEEKQEIPVSGWGARLAEMESSAFKCRTLPQYIR